MKLLFFISPDVLVGFNIVLAAAAGRVPIRVDSAAGFHMPCVGEFLQGCN